MQSVYIVIIIILVIGGIVTGFIAALLGIGGGFLNVPLLTIIAFLDLTLIAFLDIHVAISTSMFVILIASISASVDYVRQKRVIFKAALFLEGAAILGAVLSSFLKVFIESIILSYIFCLSLGITGVFIVVKALRKPEKDKPASKQSRSITPVKNPFYIVEGSWLDNENVENLYKFNVFHMMPLMFVAGFVAGLIGIGGGIVQVPVMIELCGFPIHLATSTSSFMIMITAFFSTLTNIWTLQLPLIAIIFGAILAAGEIVGAIIGARFSARVPATTLRITFGGALVGISIYYFLYTNYLYFFV